MKESTENNGNIIEINEARIKKDLSGLVRETVEETLNGMLDAEADALCNAERYSRTPERKDTRAGHYKRNLETTAGKVTLKVPKLRTIPFESAIIKRYQRREISVEEAMIEMYLAGVSVRRVEDVTEALWGTRVSPSTVSNLNKKIYERIDTWRKRKLGTEYPYVYVDGLVLKKSWAGEVRNISILVAMGVNEQGYREILGSMEGEREDKASWTAFLRDLKSRGLKGTRLVISDKCTGLVESATDIFPNAKWQRCVFHFHRNVLTQVPRKLMADVAAKLKAIHAQEDLESALKKADQVIDDLRKMKLTPAAKILEDGVRESLIYMEFPREHRVRIRTNNPLERIIKEIKRRTKVVGAFPDGESALVLATARLRYIAGTKWGTRRYLNMKHLTDMEQEQKTA